MAGIRQFIESIMAELSTVQVVNQDTDVVYLYVRLWNNQVEREMSGETYNYPKPAAFVEVANPVQLDEIGQNFRTGRMAVNVHIVHEYYNEDGTFEQDLEIFDLRDKIVEKLSQFKPTGSGQMFSTGEEVDYDHPNVIHYTVFFVCEFIDSKGSPWDPPRNNFVDKQPPTGLNIIGAKASGPLSNPIQQPYKIPN